MLVSKTPYGKSHLVSLLFVSRGPESSQTLVLTLRRNDPFPNLPGEQGLKSGGVSISQKLAPLFKGKQHFLLAVSTFCRVFSGSDLHIPC